MLGQRRVVLLVGRSLALLQEHVDGHCTHPGLFAPQNVDQLQRSNSPQTHARCRRSDSTLFSMVANAQFNLDAET